MKDAFAGCRLRRFTHRLADDCTGATAIEYALVALLISVAIAGALPAFAPALNNTFNTISAKL
ncbi:MAG TPA: Flp family type IVb pilin [Stellaceae bacterium]|jgi:pilus assembly protein Flp/PilA|nr:Flp family type IVb pilin [Stellaceae bacterium]